MTGLLKTYTDAIAIRFGLSEDQAFEVLSISLILDKPFDEVFREICVGDSRDGGFDGIYIDDQSNTLYIFQCKNSASLNDGELTVLKQRYNDIFVSGNQIGVPLNPKVLAKLHEYKDLTEKGEVLVPKIFFAYSGKNNDPSKAANMELFKRHSQTGFQSLEIIDSDALLSRAASLQRTRRNEIKFSFKPQDTDIVSFSGQALFSFHVAEVRAVNFRIKALELCELMDLEVTTNGSADTLFTDNIRGFLGHNKANKRILETLKDRNRSRFFPFMNNGITIICPEMTLPGSAQSGQYNVPVKNPIIVNGLQTSKIIYELYKSDPAFLTDVSVTVKLYEAKNPELIELITEATNTQTAINFRDQMSNKEFNRWAHDVFASKSIKYVSKRGEILKGNDLSSGLTESVSNELVIKYWYATYYGDPHLAKTSKKTVLENVFLATKDENPALSDLFSGKPDSPVYEQLYNSYLIYKFVSAKRDELELLGGHEYILHADELMAFGVYEALRKDNKLSDLKQEDIASVYDVVQKRIKANVEAEKKRRGKAYADSKYFKSEGSIDDYKQSMV
jgi:hypothetical protein